MDVPLFKKEDTFLPKLKGYVKSVIEEHDTDSLTLRKVLRQRVRESARATKVERARALFGQQLHHKRPVERARWLTRDDVANDDEQVREILADKHKVDIDKYKLNIREFVDELVAEGS